VHKLLSTEHLYRVIDDLHHHAFLPPFPDSISAEVGEPAQNPSGFYRWAFLEKRNGEVVDFFRESLVRK
jgi:hypothetical protein